MAAEYAEIGHQRSISPRFEATTGTHPLLQSKFWYRRHFPSKFPLWQGSKSSPPVRIGSRGLWRWQYRGCSA